MNNGLHFCNVDLHVHTPQSECFIEPEVTPEMIVEQALKAKLKAIAITDHNSASWVDQVKKAAEGKGLTVFPGVEITVNPGVHVLAIFSENNTGSQINDLLSELGLTTTRRDKSEAVVTRYGVQEVVSKIAKEYGALPVLAHIDDEKGAWKVLRDSGQTLINLWEAAEFAAVEIVGDSLPSEIGNDTFPYIPAYYWASDSPHPLDPRKHSHLGIGKRYSQFKICEPVTWEGLRLCFLNPKGRIRPAAEVLDNHPTLGEITINGGFLNEFQMHMNPNLNCLIGGRGTGKSCLLELIRYAFDISPKTDANSKQSEGLIDFTFPAGSRISISFKLSDGTSYRTERNSGQKPLVYRDGCFDPLPINPSDLLTVQAYGQKEVYEISQEPTFQLGLLDNYLAESLRPLQNQENDLVKELKDNASEILKTQEDLENDLEEISTLGAIEEELRRMKQHSFVPRLEQRSSYMKEKELLENAGTQINQMKTALTTFEKSNGIKLDQYSEEKLKDLPNSQLLANQGAILSEINMDFHQSVLNLKNRIETAWNNGSEKRQEWEELFKEQDKSYQELLLNFQTDMDSLKPERFIELEAKQRRLFGKADEVKGKQEKIALLLKNRKILLNLLRKNRRSQYETRNRKAEDLTKSLHKKIRITIWPQGNRNQYIKQLTDLFSGTGTRKEVFEQIADTKTESPERAAQRPIKFGEQTRYIVPEIPKYYDPIDLADAIRCEKMSNGIEDESPLTSLFQISSIPMRNKLSSLSQEKLFDLELMLIPDLPVIELQVTSGELGYKPLDQLSVGQKCTAILSIVLLESSAPLVIDQPEDDLDNHFIFDQIVTTLRNAKEKRQFMIATHNANIPVSGDAELIVVLDADEKHGWISREGIGSLDYQPIKQYVEKILEGGKDAFIIRKQMYGI